MRQDDFRSVRKKLISIEWSRWKEWSVGGRREGFRENREMITEDSGRKR